MSGCKGYRDNLILYLFKELTAKEREELEGHLGQCEACRRDLALLKQIRASKPHVDDKVVQENRRMLFHQIRQKKFQTASYSTAGWNVGKLAVQAGIAMCLIVFGFVLGNFRHQSSSSSPGLEALVTSAQVLKLDKGRVTPYSLNVEKIDPGHKKGVIDVVFNTANTVQLEISLDDPMIPWIIDQALRYDENPAVRLHAVKTIEQVAVSQDSLDTRYFDLLEHVLLVEDNPGVVFVTLKALGEVRTQARAQELLLQFIQTTPVEPLKIQAFKSLIDDRHVPNEIEAVLAMTKLNSNTYIQTKSLELLRKEQSL